MKVPDELTVVVEQRHIDEGIRNDCLRCPLALAVGEQWPEPKPSMYAVAVGECVGVWSVPAPDEYNAKFDLGYDGHNFVADFDAGFSVQPQTFVFKRVRADDEGAPP